MRTPIKMAACVKTCHVDDSVLRRYQWRVGKNTAELREKRLIRRERAEWKRITCCN